MTDHLRAAAMFAVGDQLRTWQTNAVANQYVWEAVNRALDAFEDEMARDSANRLQPSWAVIRDCRPVVVVPTKRMARQQRRIIATLAQEPARRWQIVSTEVALSPLSQRSAGL